MPDIFEVGDTQALLNRYAGKFILYVEGPGDRNAYRQIVGSEFLIDYDFVLPPDNKTGANSVRKRVTEERLTNRRVFGFLDGEAAAALGIAEALVRSDGIVFRPKDQAMDGLVFVAAHEIENLILCYSDVAPTIAQHKPMHRLADGEADRIREQLRLLNGRFLAAAMFKYTSLHLQHKGQCVHVANTRIFSDDSANLKAILREMKIVVTRHCQLNWRDFANELYSITRALRRHIVATGETSDEKWNRHLRLADGKALLKKVRGQAGPDVEGHLLAGLAKSEFAEKFRAAIITELAEAA
ncbi:hypothetical protein ASF03_13780 [Rhizobium sp. Leaf68]|nr:hypothetical protein ASE62_13100 [Rhizobium sp. Leaf202]KQN84319.1 hypothetical protein ASF03_13780 [Rhizobium sp. Leaf68]